MKKILLVLFSLTLIFSCASDNSGSEDNASAVFKGKINGEFFEANTISNSNLIHQTNGATQGAVLTFYSENDQYKFTFAIAEHDNDSNCMGEGDYRNSDTSNREVIIWISYKFNGNTYQVHFPDDDSPFDTTEFAKVTNCNNNKISGEFSGTYTKDSDFEGVTESTPQTISLTEGVFENIEFNVVN